MDFVNPKKLSFFTNCVLLWIFKLYEDGGGAGGGVIVIHFVTDATKRKYLH